MSQDPQISPAIPLVIPEVEDLTPPTMMMFDASNLKPIPREIVDKSIKPEEARKAQKEMRRDMVRRIMLRGIHAPIEIQRELLLQRPPIKLSIRSIHTYKGELIKANVIAVRDKLGLNKTVEETALELKQTFEEVLRELWRTYHSNDAGAKERVMALKEIRETTAKLTETMQSLGLIHKTPEQHQVLGADGKPVDPSSVNIISLEQNFNQFIKATYQNPVGKELPDAKQL